MQIKYKNIYKSRELKEINHAMEQHKHTHIIKAQGTRCWLQKLKGKLQEAKGERYGKQIVQSRDLVSRNKCIDL